MQNIQVHTSSDVINETSEDKVKKLIDESNKVMNGVTKSKSWMIFDANNYIYLITNYIIF